MRRYGKVAEQIKLIHEQLLTGATVIVACDIANKDYYVHALKEQHKMDVGTEAVFSTPPMKLIFDPNDESPEPGFDIYFGTKKLTGFKFFKK